MSREGVRVSLTLADLMQLNLVHRRLQRITAAGAFVGPDELEGLVSILDTVFGMNGDDLRELINNLRTAQHGG